MRRTVLALVLALALPACGSTVPQTSAGGSIQNADGLGQITDNEQLALPDGEGSAGSHGTIATGPGGVGQAGGSGGSGGSEQQGAAGPGSSSEDGTGALPPAAPGAAVGITKDTIFLGGTYSPDAATANQALGAGSSNTGDQRDYFNAVINEVNARGGVLGRKLKGVYAAYRASSSEPMDQQSQSACELWFKDNKVFTVYDDSDIVYECSATAGAVAFGGGAATAPVYAANPHLVAPNSIRPERLSSVTVNALVGLKWHVPDATWKTGKIGVLTWDDKAYKYGYEQGIKKALTRHGLRVTDARFIKVPQTANGISDSSAAIANAVLRFQEQDIDHVLIQDGPAGMFSGGGLTLLFLQSAESQSYRPRYGFNANNFPGDAAYPPAQQRGMLAVDHNDYTAERDAGISPNKQRVRCFEVMKKAGLDISSDQTQGQAALACDYVWFVEQTFKRAGTPTREAFLKAADASGTSFGSSFTYGTRLAPGRRDGVELFRTSRYEEGPTGCGCMRYTSKPFAP